MPPEVCLSLSPKLSWHCLTGITFDPTHDAYEKALPKFSTMIGAVAPRQSSALGCEPQQRRQDRSCRRASPCPVHVSPRPAAFDLRSRQDPAIRSHAIGIRRPAAHSALCATGLRCPPCGSHSKDPVSSRRSRMSAAVVTATAAAAAGNGGPAGAAGATCRDLLVVGPGVLGSFVGRLWLEAFPGSTVVGQTNTTSSHDR